MKSVLVQRWDIDDYNIFENDELIDYSALWQIVNHKEFSEELPSAKPPVKPLTLVEDEKTLDLFDFLKDHDLLLHHPYNSFNYVLDLIEEAADDPNVLAIKVTIYRLAKNSRISAALLRAAENGKHVSVLFEVKARFDEENNIKEAQRLQKAGCFVVYGVNKYKTHTKLLLIVRKDSEDQVVTTTKKQLVCIRTSVCLPQIKCMLKTLASFLTLSRDIHTRAYTKVSSQHRVICAQNW
jgi:polyphosphate kinase